MRVGALQISDTAKTVLNEFKVRYYKNIAFKIGLHFISIAMTSLYLMAYIAMLVNSVLDKFGLSTTFIKADTALFVFFTISAILAGLLEVKTIQSMAEAWEEYQDYLEAKQLSTQTGTKLEYSMDKLYTKVAEALIIVIVQIVTLVGGLQNGYLMFYENTTLKTKFESKQIEVQQIQHRLAVLQKDITALETGAKKPSKAELEVEKAKDTLELKQAFLSLSKIYQAKKAEIDSWIAKESIKKSNLKNGKLKRWALMRFEERKSKELYPLKEQLNKLALKIKEAENIKTYLTVGEFVSQKEAKAKQLEAKRDQLVRELSSLEKAVKQDRKEAVKKAGLFGFIVIGILLIIWQTVIELNTKESRELYYSTLDSAKKSDKKNRSRSKEARQIKAKQILNEPEALSPKASRVLAGMIKHWETEGSLPSIAKLEQLTGMGKTSVKEGRYELKQKGYYELDEINQLPYPTERFKNIVKQVATVEAQPSTTYVAN